MPEAELYLQLVRPFASCFLKQWLLRPVSCELEVRVVMVRAQEAPAVFQIPVRGLPNDSATLLVLVTRRHRQSGQLDGRDFV